MRLSDCELKVRREYEEQQHVTYPIVQRMKIPFAVMFTVYKTRIKIGLQSQHPPNLDILFAYISFVDFILILFFPYYFFKEYTLLHNVRSISVVPVKSRLYNKSTMQNVARMHCAV